MVPLRVLSRTNLAGFSPFISSISFSSFRLRTLDLSLRSFSDTRPLFSTTSALFLQNTRGGIPPSFSVSASTPCALRRGAILSLVFPRPSRPLSYLPLESTLVKVYQNKQLHLPLESTLVKNRGEGGVIVN